MKNHFKRIKLRKNNYANKSTDKRNVFLRGYISPIIFFWKVFTWGKNFTISKKREVLKSKDKSRKYKFNFLAKF